MFVRGEASTHRSSRNLFKIRRSLSDFCDQSYFGSVLTCILHSLRIHSTNVGASRHAFRIHLEFIESVHLGAFTFFGIYTYLMSVNIYFSHSPELKL